MNKNIGDILITFHVSSETLPSRSSAPWKEVARFDDAQVHITEPDEHWRGFPLRIHQDQCWQIWALGEFYGDKNPDLTKALETSADLNGHFLLIGYEVPEKRWHILTDHFGTVHAYLADDGARVALGTFSPAVAEAASSKILDREAVGGFFSFGFFLDDKTYWVDLRIIKPATHTILDQHGRLLSERRTWTWSYTPDSHLSYENAIVEFGKIFETVVRDQVRDQAVALPISGGLDSRSTLIPLTTQDRDGAKSLIPFSYGYGEDSVEIAIAKKLAQKRHLNLKTWQIQPYLFEQIEHLTAVLEGFQDFSQPRQAFVVEELGHRASHVLAAHWGDVWLDDMGFMDAPNQISNSVLAKKLLHKFTKRGSDLLLNVFTNVLPSALKGVLERQLEQSLAELTNIDEMDFKIKAWKTQNWAFRWTLASLRAYQIGLFPILPFYDHRLADFFSRLPTSYVADRKLQIDYLKHYAPELARVKWQPYDADLYHYQHFKSWLLPKRAVKKLGSVLSGEKIIQRNWEVQFLNPKGKLGLQDWLLSPGLNIHSLVPRENLEIFINELYKLPDAANGYAASMLLTFSAWLEAYG